MMWIWERNERIARQVVETETQGDEKLGRGAVNSREEQRAKKTRKGTDG